MEKIEFYYNCQVSFLISPDCTLQCGKIAGQGCGMVLTWLFLLDIAVVTYHLTVFSRNILTDRSVVHMTACIHGTHGDTGDRSLLWPLQNVQQGDDSEVLYLKLL